MAYSPWTLHVCKINEFVNYVDMRLYKCVPRPLSTSMCPIRTYRRGSPHPLLHPGEQVRSRCKGTVLINPYLKSRVEIPLEYSKYLQRLSLSLKGPRKDLSSTWNPDQWII